MKKLIQSYVNDKYFVSTGYRESSAAVTPVPWYYETLVWEWDAKTKKRGEMLPIQEASGYRTGALEKHIDICEALSVDCDKE